MSKRGWGYGRRSSEDARLRRLLRIHFESEELKVYKIDSYNFSGSIINIKIIINKKNKTKMIILTDNIHKPMQIKIDYKMNLDNICKDLVQIYIDKFTLFNSNYKSNIEVI